jgi:acylphosphatase
MDQASKITRQFWVSGRVQGVFYRASTREQALRLHLTGYAKNLSDGTVEVLACGDEAALQALEKWLWRGPMAAEVRDVKSMTVEGDLALYEGFAIK